MLDVVHRGLTQHLRENVRAGSGPELDATGCIQLLRELQGTG